MSIYKWYVCIIFQVHGNMLLAKYQKWNEGGKYLQIVLKPSAYTFVMNRWWAVNSIVPDMKRRKLGMAIDFTYEYLYATNQMICKIQFNIKYNIVKMHQSYNKCYIDLTYYKIAMLNIF